MEGYNGNRAISYIPESYNTCEQELSSHTVRRRLAKHIPWQVWSLSDPKYEILMSHKSLRTKEQPGVIPQAINDVFKYIAESKSLEFLLRVSYLEIYNETLRDLLSPEAEDLQIREDKKRGVYVSPLKEEIVTSAKQVMNIVARGEAHRHTSVTDYNLYSSRSHTVFQMIIECRPKGYKSSVQSITTSRFANARGDDGVRISKLSLIDLAGSEKAASSTERRMEGAYINKSLLTLGTVISKLTEKNSSHIPYRDSKLTRILQGSLSGNARVSVICTISPTLMTLEESRNTLQFAARVKRVVTRAQSNAINDKDALIQKYEAEIADLKAQLQSTNEVFAHEKERELTQLKAEREKHEDEMAKMQLLRTALKNKIDHMTKLILSSESTMHGSHASLVQCEPVARKEGNGNRSHHEEALRNEIQMLRELMRQKNVEIGHLQRQLSASEDPTIFNLRDKEIELAQYCERNQCHAVMMLRSERSKWEEQHLKLLHTISDLEADLALTKAELSIYKLQQEQNAINV
ncbi:hypothetical protein BZG36_01276 [Bifiguratus adelaidae]|uniref:Kinesin-like protein n=1 Tax=Bifiguratus adelaidae TaxID=1938954 RepID=A0A261Y5E1_9FUNG|nr:hypothetical protein BZG36_01276 [Bifiguratus adelaidae]